jgi:D-serine deaminase-like pyridoxal phosphate-dependent protein
MLISELDTPVVLVDLGILEDNINRAAARARAMNVALRPHVKTHKIPAIALMQVEKGACGIAAQKLSEAAVMVEEGINDVFVPFPIVGKLKIDRLVSLMRRAHISVGLDSLPTAAALSERLVSEGLSLDVLIEIDTGLQRCGLPPGEPAVEFARILKTMPGIVIKGIFTHEGQVYLSRNPAEVGSAAVTAAEEMVRTAGMMRANAIGCEIVSVGSTPGANSAPGVRGITEMRPGIYVFNDATQIRLGVCGPERCALTVLTTVVSRPSPARVIIDAGSKTMSSDVSRADGTFGVVLGEPEMVFDRASEEHGIIRVNDRCRALEIGDQLRIIPNHVCTTVNMHDIAYGVRGEIVVCDWPITGRGKVQ